MSDASKTPAREGSLDAPFRHPIDWRDEAYYDLAKVEAEMERQFDVCHTCRRCFNLCDSFPRLFDLIDESPTGELDSVPKAEYAKVDEACTLCDMCFLTKCPYVPPHPFDIDIPHLMLRYRAARRRIGEKEVVREELGRTDRNGRLAAPVAPLVNWATAQSNKPVRKIIEAAAGVDAQALLPTYTSRTASRRLREPLSPSPEGPAYGKRRAVIYATCIAEFNAPQTAEAAARVLARQGVEARLVYPECCGMPELEAGNLADVAARAERVAAVFAPFIHEGFEIVTLTASCGLMAKFEWPLLHSGNHAVARLSAATRDICEYVVGLSREFGLAEGLSPVEGGITVHHACHARAQNMGAKSAEMLRLIPGAKVDVVERCSGHGGTFGVMKDTRPIALKVGAPTARQVMQKGNANLCSDCQLACGHLGEILAEMAPEGAGPRRAHPIEILARAYSLA
ncbi:MAG TPA: heterodisulfide reductase-related iron-sulfur binding cluster [Caulobacteraceae bacterium]